MTKSNICITLLHAPASLDASDAAHFLEDSALANLVEEHERGTGDFWLSPQARLVAVTPTDYEHRVVLNARVGGAGGGPMVGRPSPTPDSSSALRPATGTGAIEPTSPAVGFARRLGFALEQVERMGLLVLRSDSSWLVSLAGGAAVPAGYELPGCGARSPDDLLAGYAQLRRRMSTEVPQGALGWGEEDWTPERIRLEESEQAPEGREVLVTVAREHSSGDLVGHTVLTYFPAKPEVAFQEDTLVLPDHRGHRLGMALKLRNLQRLVKQWPTVRRIYTFNAAENGPMLAINDALGFVPVGCTGIWQATPARPRP